jgi:hypothetical protein
MEKLSEYLRKYSESPFVAVFGFLTVMTTFWGLVSIYRDISSWGGSRLGGVIVAVLLGFLALFVFVALFMPSLKRQYAFPSHARYLLTEIDRKWEIDPLGNGVMINDKTYLFFRPPQDEDLQDRIMGSEALSLSDIKYCSTDSTALDYEQVDEVTQRIRWKPKGPGITVGTPYRHNVKSDFPYPGSKPPTFKIMTIIAPVFTISFKVAVESEIPIKEAVAYKEGRYHKFKDADGIARRGKSIKRTQAPLPSLINEHQLTLEMDHLMEQTVYYLVLYFQ